MGPATSTSQMKQSSFQQSKLTPQHRGKSTQHGVGEAQSPKLINNGHDSDVSSELSDENYRRVIRENKIRYDPKKK